MFFPFGFEMREGRNRKIIHYANLINNVNKKLSREVGKIFYFNVFLLFYDSLERILFIEYTFTYYIYYFIILSAKIIHTFYTCVFLATTNLINFRINHCFWHYYFSRNI